MTEPNWDDNLLQLEKRVTVYDGTFLWTGTPNPNFSTWVSFWVGSWGVILTKS